MKTQKYTRPLIVFKTPFYEPTYCEFRNPPELQKFLADFNFMRSHELTDWSVGRPEFQLGTRLEFDIDDYLCESNIKWGRDLLLGAMCAWTVKKYWRKFRWMRHQIMD